MWVDPSRIVYSFTLTGNIIASGLLTCCNKYIATMTTSHNTWSLGLVIII